MQRKSEAWKKLIGTYKPSREKKHVAIEDPEWELASARDLLAAMRLNLKLANSAIREFGMRMEFLSKDKNGNIVSVYKSNPALRIQTEACRTIHTVAAQVTILEEQVTEIRKKQALQNEWADFHS